MRLGRGRRVFIWACGGPPPFFEDRIPDMPVVEGKHYAYTPAGRKKARAAAKRIGKKMKRGKRVGKKPRRLA